MAGWYSSKVNASVAPAGAARPPLGIGEVFSALGRSAGAISEQNRATDEKLSEIDFAIGEREKARVRDDASARAATALAQGEGEYDRFVIDNQNDAQFESKVNARVDADMQALQGMLGDDPVLGELYAPVLARTAEARRTNAHRHVAAVRAKASADAFDAGRIAWLNVVSSHPERTEEAVGAVTASVMANNSIPDALKPGIVHKATGELWLQGLEANARAGRYEAVGQELDAGSYDAVLPEGGKDGLQRLIGAQRAVDAAEAEAAADEARRKASDGLKATRIAIDNGEQIPAATIAAQIADAKAKGVPDSELLDAAYLGEDMIYDSAFRGMDTPKLTAQLEVLRVKQAAGKLNDRNGRRMLERGKLVLEERAVKQSDTLGDLWKTGPEGQKAVIAEMHGMTIEQRFDTAARLDNPGLVYVASLPPKGQEISLEGQNLRRADKNAYLPEGSDGKPDRPAMEAEFNRIVPLSIRSTLGDGGVALREAAMDYFAGSQQRAGGGGQWSRSGFEKSVSTMFGGRKRADGKIAGGLGVVRGRTIELPDGVTADEFDVRISRYDFAREGAVYLDGSAARNADVLFNYQPVPDHQDPKTGELIYRFQDSNGTPLRRRDGSVFGVAFAKQAPARRAPPAAAGRPKVIGNRTGLGY